MTGLARCGLVAVAVLNVAVLAACGGGNERGESQTPRLRADSRNALAEALLTTKDLRSVRGLPADIEAASLDELPLYEDPDPRGPCGARIDQPDLARGQSVALRSDQAAGFTAVVRLPIAQARAYMKALAADTRVGCPPHQRRTHTGSVQRVKLVSAVDIGNRGTAARVTITNKGKTVDALQIAVQDADRVAVLVLFTSAALPDNTVRAIANRASRRLQQVS